MSSKQKRVAKVGLESKQKIVVHDTCAAVVLSYLLAYLLAYLLSYGLS